MIGWESIFVTSGLINAYLIYPEKELYWQIVNSLVWREKGNTESDVGEKFITQFNRCRNFISNSQDVFNSLSGIFFKSRKSDINKGVLYLHI